ncbi:putative pp-loop family protein [Rosellinia necatrix]|uniref:tRNA(Ile)-lysidine synthetase n=1 Tax=Rosellinia necatrix TaxID=77044 RepID=A0A1W2TUE0_ROSNE|nr:putative pp-loop family protein [Rosellinia necatrix]
MGTLSRVLHTGARPVSVHEFAEALRAICPPHFPGTTRLNRTVGLAVSGGVDSMALAYLCSRLKNGEPNFRVTDNPISGFRAIVVDHQIRDGSREEAKAVAAELSKLGLDCIVDTASWSQILGPGRHPKDLPNLESVARRLRYRRLGRVCGTFRIASLLFAHHEDDQYETVLMRLLNGHGTRGLRGMRAVSDIPECEGIHGAYQSGSVDDQAQSLPSWNSEISKKEYKNLKHDLSRLMHDEGEPNDDDPGWLYPDKQAAPLEVANIDVEGGGVMIYRPLLGFSKDRLIATCEANNVLWWEDGTNHDQTLTMRNAVRHMCKNYTLPLALQKPSVLAFSRRCDQRARALEAEAGRLLARTIIHDFEPNIGSTTVQFPKYGLSRFPRDTSSPLRRRARTLRQREVAGLLIQKIIALVSPEEQTAPLSNLQNVISRLFPALAIGDWNITGPPKAFSIAGVQLTPIGPSSNKSSSSFRNGGSRTWYLSRASYPSHQPIPRFHSHSQPLQEIPEIWPRWTRWETWDGRFWFRMRSRLPSRVILQPFLKEHAKAFRERIPPEDRDRLVGLLKRYAPAKTRYTLPALYFEEGLNLDFLNPYYCSYPPSSPHNLPGVAAEGSKHAEYPGNTMGIPSDSDHLRAPDTCKMRLIALPSLGIQIPGLGSWIQYEIRYRRVDAAMLDAAGSFHRGSFASPRRQHPPSHPPGPRTRARRSLDIEIPIAAAAAVAAARGSVEVQA